jgi:dimethylamine monooxygenase subunit A
MNLQNCGALASRYFVCSFPDMTPNWMRIFPDADFRMSMALRPGNAATYWSSWDTEGALLAERRRWLFESPGLYTGCLPEGAAAMMEAREWMRLWGTEPEADWVVLSGASNSEPVVLAGEVVFPTAWSLPEKLGLPLSAVHAPVPELQASIGAGVNTFLARIESRAEWERDNWGLCANTELNHHPSRNLPRLTAQSRMESTWVRLENQFLTRLPETGCLLFGIRVSHYRLDAVAALPGMAERIARALRTMPESMAKYKGLAAARPALIGELGSPH